MNWPRLPALVAALPALVLAVSAPAQEQIDKADVRAKGSAAIAKMGVRVRVTRSVPESELVRVSWRRGGEGLGGTVTRGRGHQGHTIVISSPVVALPKDVRYGWAWNLVVNLFDAEGWSAIAFRVDE